MLCELTNGLSFHITPFACKYVGIHTNELTNYAFITCSTGSSTAAVTSVAAAAAATKEATNKCLRQRFCVSNAKQENYSQQYYC